MASRKKEPDDDALEASLGELKAQTDRGAAIIAAGLLDDYLAFAILARLRPLSNSQREALLDHNGALGSFSSKIAMAYALRVVGQTMRADLDLIRKIRNKFAHKIEPLTFADAEINSWCAALSTAQDSPDRKKNFLASFAAINVTLIAVKDTPDIGISKIGFLKE